MLSYLYFSKFLLGKTGCFGESFFSRHTQHHGQKCFQGNNVGPELKESWHEKQVGRAGEGKKGDVKDKAEAD